MASLMLRTGCDTDLFHDVAELAQGRGGRFYFLGAGASVMEEAIRIVRRHYPRLAIAGKSAWACLPHNPSRCATATGCAASA
jgi:UDP-N-acetyl-D-mannosaminuronic acid transferase (WecB/TagA/CpsF family)